MTRESYPWAADFDWEWYLTHLGLSARAGEQPFKKAWTYIPECDDRKTGIRDLEELIEFRLETGIDAWSLEEAEFFK